ncbi:MAG TPA: N-acetyltransferase [Thermodesulfobacteriota bacterium]|jgi:GNAT superfamily N-acetyltransferase
MPAGKITIQEVKNKKQFKAFLRFPWQIYRGDPYWVPPLLKEHAFYFSPKNPFLHHAEIFPAVAIRDGSIVGRIAAIIDHNYIDFHQEKTGFFGFFESIDDKKVARTLVDHAKGLLRAKGLKQMMGPVNPSTNDECGLLIDGFDSSPFFMMSYNPPSYRKLLEGCGLKKAKDLLANRMINDGSIPERLLRISARLAKKTPGLTIRPLNMKKLGEEVMRVKNVYNGAWRDNWGFVPLTDEEMDLMVTKMKPLVIPEYVPFAEIGGETAGFALALPDYNVAIKKVNGRLGPVGLLKFLYYSRKIRTIRVMLLGVKAEYRKRGIETLLYLEIFRRGQARGVTWGEMSWILEDNHLMQRGLEALGAKIYKTYRIYQAPL